MTTGGSKEAASKLYVECDGLGLPLCLGLCPAPGFCWGRAWSCYFRGVCMAGCGLGGAALWLLLLPPSCGRLGLNHKPSKSYVDPRCGKHDAPEPNFDMG